MGSLASTDVDVVSTGIETIASIVIYALESLRLSFLSLHR